VAQGFEFVAIGPEVLLGQLLGLLRGQVLLGLFPHLTDLSHRRSPSCQCSHNEHGQGRHTARSSRHLSLFLSPMRNRERNHATPLWTFSGRGTTRFGAGAGGRENAGRRGRNASRRGYGEKGGGGFGPGGKVDHAGRLRRAARPEELLLLER